MYQPVFRNIKSFEIEVSTPSGGSRIVPPGKFFAGDYFMSYHEQTGNSELMPKAFKPLEKDLICSFTNHQVAKDSVDSFIATVSEADRKEIVNNLVAENLPSKSESATETKEDIVKKGGRPKKNDLENTSKELMKELGNTTPTVSEIDSLSNEDLRKLATKYSVSTVLGREETIKMLKEKVAQ